MAPCRTLFPLSSNDPYEASQPPAESPTVDPNCGRVSYTQFEFLYAREKKKKTSLENLHSRHTAGQPRRRNSRPH